MNNLCVIPARKNSKRLPEKNKIYVNSELNINRLVRIAEETGLFYEIIVYTDDEEIYEEAKNAVMRNKVEANQTMAEMVDEIKDLYSHADTIMILYATALFVEGYHLKLAYAELEKWDCVIPITQTHSIAHVVNANMDTGKVTPFNMKTKDINVSGPTYKHAGQWWLIRRSAATRRSIFPENTGHMLYWEAVDIDYYKDLEMAKLLLPKLNIDYYPDYS
jgi:CMP-N-acetylneuraminic acid synthetase